MILVDTNVLIDVLEDDPQWADWSIGQLRAQAQVHALAINPIVHAELSLAFERWEQLEAAVGHSWRWWSRRLPVPRCSSPARRSRAIAPPAR